MGPRQLRFHPIPDDLGVVIDSGEFARAVVIDESISEIYDRVGEVRYSHATDTGLPRGLYSFAGFDSPLLMQVAVGPTGPSSELSLPQWDDSLEHPLAEAYRWAEHLWGESRTIPEPKFALRERVMTVPAGEDVEVRERRFDDGRWSYTVRGDGERRQVLEDRLQAIEAADSPDEWVQGERSTAARLGATLTRTKLRGRFADTVYSFQATRTTFRPYQFKPVLRLLQTGRARILIADEVGLGKTIEAGLIWTELEARREADRVLIVCPSNLVDKWRDEMRERFDHTLVHLNSDELARFLEQHRTGRLPDRAAYVASLETLRTWRGLEELEDSPPEFDLIVVDEAHAMRNSTTKSYALGTQLSEWAIGSNMVFLTATPINLRETDLLHLLGLLEPADFDTVDDLEARLQPNAVLNELARMLPDQSASAAEFERVLAGLHGMAFARAIAMRPEFGELREIIARAPLAPKDIAYGRRLIGELNQLSTTVTRTRRAEVDEKKAIREAAGIEVVWSEAESEFYQEFLEWCRQRAELSGTPMYFSMQMKIRLASTSAHLAARDVLHQSEADVWEGDTKRGSSWVEPSPELVKAARRLLETPETKLQKLAGVLDELHGLQRQAILFSWSKGTLRALKAEFGDRYRIAVLNGDVRTEQRRKIMKDFRAGGYDFLFANRVASEGLDFEFCSAVINYDLPWNPMEIEQRIGRIDRIGQESEKILIRTFYNDEAIDSRIMYRVLERIDIFERSIGELEPIIGDLEGMLTAAMDFNLTPAQREEKAQQYLTAIEEQRAGIKNVAESAAGLIISNSLDIAGLEEELIASGRYLGQVELAHLLEDWARTDGGELIWADNGQTIELRGNSAMANRVLELVQRGLRTRSEAIHHITGLQNNSPQLLALDQELARTSGMDLLTANHPLTMAAAEVPGHRHARFASVQLRKTEGVIPGRYLVVLAHAEHASRGGDEIWGVAVDPEGNSVGEAPADAVLAALAKGTLAEGRPLDIVALPRLAKRAMRELERRHREVQERRDIEEGALTEARRVILHEQHERRLKGIQRRMSTLIERGRSPRVVHMVQSQSRRQRERHEQLLAELELRKPATVSLRYLAVCAVEVVG